MSLSSHPSPEPTPSVRSASEQAVLLAALKDAVTRAYEEGRQAAIREMERAGSLKQLIKSVDGTELGTIGQAEGKWVTEVDVNPLVDWALEHRPGEVIQPVPQLVIREAFLEWLKGDAVRRAKDGQPPYPMTGQGERIPGVKAVWKPGNVSVHANPEAKDRAARFLDELLEGARGLPAAGFPKAVTQFTSVEPYPGDGMVHAPDVATFPEPAPF